MASQSDIQAAIDGDKKALERVVRAVQDRVHRLAMRMLANPEDAREATQEILIRVVTKLSTFRGESSFETWVYRIASNHLLTVRKGMAGLTFEAFEADLHGGLSDTPEADDTVMLNELRMACTMAMLLCLDVNHRLAYVLGDILEMDHTEAASLMDIAPATYRKRLSRARADVQTFTARVCGLANPAARCSCPRRLPAARAMNRLPPAPTPGAPSYAAAKAAAARVADDLKAITLQRATGALACPSDLATALLAAVEPPG